MVWSSNPANASEDPVVPLRSRARDAGGDKERAASLLLRAEADADLAVALAREDAEKVDAAQAMQRVHELQRANP